MKLVTVLILICTLILAFEGCEENPKDSVRYIDSNFNGFEKYEVAEVLINNCASAGCHIGSIPAGDIALDSYYSLVKGAVHSNSNHNHTNTFEGEVVVPYKAEKSLLYQMMMKNVSPIIPHDGINLTNSEKEIIKNWINEGVKDFNGSVTSNNSSYRVYVCNQSSDIISVIDGDKKVVSRLIDVNFNSTIDAPHMVKEFGDYLYSTVISAGKFLKIRKSDNQIIGEVNGLEKPGMIQINSTGTKAYVSRSSTASSIYNTIYVIDLTTMSITKEISLPVTGVPHAIALNPSNTKLYVANLTKDRISIVDAVNDEFVDDIILPLGTEPMESMISPDGNYLYVSGMGVDKVIVVDAISDSIFTEINVSEMPMHIAVSSTGNRIYVSTMMHSATGSSVDVIEKSGTSWNRIAQITDHRFNMLHGCDITKDDKYVYVSSRNIDGMYQPKFKINGEGNLGTLGIIDTETLTVLKVIDLEEFPSGLVVEKK
jgi:YVTN family beta-propeller protein